MLRISLLSSRKSTFWNAFLIYVGEGVHMRIITRYVSLSRDRKIVIILTRAKADICLDALHQVPAFKIRISTKKRANYWLCKCVQIYCLCISGSQASGKCNLLAHPNLLTDQSRTFTPVQASAPGLLHWQRTKEVTPSKANFFFSEPNIMQANLPLRPPSVSDHISSATSCPKYQKPSQVIWWRNEEAWAQKF